MNGPTHQRTRLRLVARAAVLTLVAALLTSNLQTSSADIDINVETGLVDLNLNAVADGIVTSVNSATSSLLGILTDGACEAGNQLGEPARTTLCALGMLTFTVRSVYDKPNGTVVVRETPVVFSSPAPVDVTGDGFPDVSVLVGLTSLNRLTVSINRTLFAPATTPAKVELIARDPTNLGTPSRVSFGYDQRGGTIPSTFDTSFTLTGISPLRFDVGASQTGATPALKLVASMFQLQNDGTRTVRADAEVGFKPAPASTTYDVTLGDERQNLDVRSTPTRVDAKVELIDNTEVQQITATIDTLPSKVSVEVLENEAGLRTVNYSTDQPINRIEGYYRQLTRYGPLEELTMEAHGKVTGMPTGATFTQLTPESARFSTANGAIGSVEGGFALGGPVQKVPAGESGALMRSNGDQISIAGRLLGLREATIALGGPYFVDVTSQSQPLHLRAEDSPTNTVIDAHVKNLPARVAMTIDLENSKISYDAFGSEIDEITLDGTSDGPFAGPIKRVHAGLYGIPAAFDLTYDVDDDGFSAQMTDPVDRIELAVDDGTNSVQVPGALGPDGTPVGPVDSGAALFLRENTIVHPGGAFAAAARIFGLEALAVRTLGEEWTSMSVSTAPGHVFTAVADVPLSGHPVTFAAEVDTLPGTVAVALNTPEDGPTKVDYDADGAEIERLQVNAAGLAPLTGRIDTIRGTITDLPPSLRLVAGSDTPYGTGPVFVLDTYGDAIGRIEAQALSSGATPVSFPLTVPTHDGQLRTTVDGVYLKDLVQPSLRPGEFVAALGISGVRGASLQVQPHVQLKLDVDQNEAEVFGVLVESQTTYSPFLTEPEVKKRTAITEYEGFVDRLPANMALDIAPSDSEALKYTADNRIEEIFVRSREKFGGTDAADIRLGDILRVRVQDLPTFLRVCTADGPNALDGDRCPYEPRPDDWPAPGPPEDYVHGEHIVVAHIDDGGTSSPGEPMTIDFYACLQAGEFRGCGWRADDDTEHGPKRYVKVDDFRIHNLFLDLYLDTCGAARQCGHVAIDTNQTKLSGDIRFFDATIDGLDHVVARVELPENFLANDRYVFWDYTELLAAATEVIGGVTCLSETFLGVEIHPLGGGAATVIDGGDYLLQC